ncbi:MAG TPA: helix-turn-helix transcriptional regulator [Pseudonocardiaceae bacterium]|nr:helix-turn-helix transcriptional regulator [Pseudonocardiaceae bacterium]
MDAEEARTIGQQLRRIRKSRGKSRRVLAELAGMSRTTLQRIESGQRALDKRSEVVALATVLQIAPSELTRLPVPAPANGETDSAIGAVRQALMAVSRNRPGGQVVSVEELRARVQALHDPGYPRPDVGAALPSLIRDLHTSIAAGQDVAELLGMAVLFHTQDTRGWLWLHGAPLDLRWQASCFAQRAAQELDNPTALGVAAWGAVIEMIGGGAFDLAETELESLSVPTNSPESMQLAGMLALSRSLVAASDRRPGDVDAPLEYAAELAQRTGQGNAYWMGFGPTNVGIWRMTAALEVGDHAGAAALAEGVNPDEHPSRERQATYWIEYGRALARLRGREADAVMAFRRGEILYPIRLQRNMFARDVLAELLTRVRRGSPVDRELRGMAYRAGLPV